MFIAIASLAALAGCGDKASTMDDFTSTEVTLPNGAKLVCKVMRADIDLTRGLMFVDSLPSNHGMLFEFIRQQPHPEWMYQHKFAIDTIWMDDNHEIDEIVFNMPPCTSKVAHECPHYGGQRNSRYMLEVPAGVARQQHLKIGDKLDF